MHTLPRRWVCNALEKNIVRAGDLFGEELPSGAVHNQYHGNEMFINVHVKSIMTF